MTRRFTFRPVSRVQQLRERIAALQDSLTKASPAEADIIAGWLAEAESDLVDALEAAEDQYVSDEEKGNAPTVTSQGVRGRG